MAKSINVVHLLGRVGKDPVVRYTGSGKVVATFSLATENYKKETQWHTIVAWGGLTEKPIAKGAEVDLTGEIQYRSYEAKDGSKRYVTEIIAREITVIGAVEKETKTEITDDDIPF